MQGEAMRGEGCSPAPSPMLPYALNHAWHGYAPMQSQDQSLCRATVPSSSPVHRLQPLGQEQGLSALSRPCSPECSQSPSFWLQEFLSLIQGQQLGQVSQA